MRLIIAAMALVFAGGDAGAQSCRTLSGEPCTPLTSNAESTTRIVKVDDLQSIYDDLNVMCRGGSGDTVSTINQACDTRTKVGTILRPIPDAPGPRRKLRHHPIPYTPAPAVPAAIADNSVMATCTLKALDSEGITITAANRDKTLLEIIPPEKLSTVLLEAAACKSKIEERGVGAKP